MLGSTATHAKSINKTTLNHRNRTMLYERALSEVSKRLESTACSASESVFQSTADSTNRIRDKARVARVVHYNEEGVEKIDIRAKNAGGMLIATGYERIVYGDHGPYLDFKPDQVNWENFPTQVKKSKHAYTTRRILRAEGSRCTSRRRCCRSTQPASWNMECAEQSEGWLC